MAKMMFLRNRCSSRVVLVVLITLLTNNVIVVDGYYVAPKTQRHPFHEKMIPAGRYHQEWKMAVQDKIDDDVDLPIIQLPRNAVTEELKVTIHKKISHHNTKPRRWWRRSTGRDHDGVDSTLEYTYKYDKLLLQPSIASYAASSETIGIVLIHPIGVGIGRWFYERLLNAFSVSINDFDNLLILSPDLLGSGSACNPQWSVSVSSSSSQQKKHHLPLLNISDWADQLIHLMTQTEMGSNNGTAVGVDRWCVIANGGCSPIALQVAQRSLDLDCPLRKPITNIIISSAPRLSFFLTHSDPAKVAKAYKRLCGVIGKLFWWYACRKEGQFIQKFSEKNLVAHPDNLGETWRSNCYQTAIAKQGQSRYSTFAFLAGALQDGCQASLDALKNRDTIRIDVIKGRDIRRNQAKSWFWQKSKRTDNSSSSTTTTTTTVETNNTKPRKTFRDYVHENGNGGREISVGGRVSLAHEDPEGYCEAVLSFLDDDDTSTR